MFTKTEIKNKAAFYDLLQEYVKDQKTYEILAFLENKTIKSKEFSPNSFDFLFKIFVEFSQEKKPSMEIYSIKRLYDNKVFTIGNKVKRNGGYAPITSFYVFGPSLIVGCYMSGSIWLEELKK